MKVRLRLSGSKVPALVPHTNLPLSGHGRPRDMQLTSPPALLWICLLCSVSQAWVGTQGHRVSRGWKDPAQFLPRPSWGSRGCNIRLKFYRSWALSQGGASTLACSLGHRSHCSPRSIAHSPVWESRTLRCGCIIPSSGAAPGLLLPPLEAGPDDGTTIDSPVALKSPYFPRDHQGHANQDHLTHLSGWLLQKSRKQQVRMGMWRRWKRVHCGKVPRCRSCRKQYDVA